MKKKRIDQKGAPGILAIPSGYAMNAKPGPARFQIDYIDDIFSHGVSIYIGPQNFRFKTGKMILRKLLIVIDFF